MSSAGMEKINERDSEYENTKNLGEEIKQLRQKAQVKGLDFNQDLSIDEDKHTTIPENRIRSPYFPK